MRSFLAPAASVLLLVALPATAQESRPATAPPPPSSIVGTLPGLPPLGVTGQTGGDYFGSAVAPAGDVNGDGYPDIVIGAPYNDAGGGSAGRAYIYFGGPSRENTPGVILTGEATGDYFGSAVAGAGDVNGDGYDDVIVGAYGNDATGSNVGRAYVYFGGPAMDTLPDVTFTGSAAGESLGLSVSGAGDVNGDGFDDVVVGVPIHSVGGTARGRAYVYFGGAVMNLGVDVLLRGQAAGDYFGIAVARAGDVDGDGFDDVVVGAYGNDTGGTDRGRVYVFLGGAAMDATADVMMSGEASVDDFGRAVAGAGDVNGDGYDDLLVGARLHDTGGTNAGRAYVYFGGAPMNVGVDVTLTGATGSDFFGTAVAGVGDANGDGYDDVLVGASGNDAGGPSAGRAHVYFGGGTMDASADVTVAGQANEQAGSAVSGAGDLDGDGRADWLVGAIGYDAGRGRAMVLQVRLTGEDLPDVFVTGAAAGDNLTAPASSAGDVNGDGYDDLLVRAPGNDAGGADAGRAYVYYGGPETDTVPDVTLTGAAAGDLFGLAAAGAGDVNGDGYDDIIIGTEAPSAYAGRAYIFFGAAAMDAVADVTLNGVATGDQFGSAVAGAGDVNGDGYDDVIVGADGVNVNRGRAYLYYGGAVMNTVTDVTLNGEAEQDRFGASVAGAGDVNGDGYDDVVVGANGNDAAGSNAGRAYVYLGGPAMNNTPDVTVTGEAISDNYGLSVSGAGDVNGDGYDDIVVGAYANNAGGLVAGRAYVYFGSTVMNNGVDVTLTGAASADLFGFSVSGAGDVNGDGYDDVIVGAYSHDAGGDNAGRAYVYFGGVAMDAVADVTMTGVAAGDGFGHAVAGAGDVNGDGAADLLVGAPFNDAGGNSAGRAYLYLSTYPAAAPRIAAVRDVPDDQGGFVTVDWTASAYDREGRVTEYLVERSDPDASGGVFWEPVATIPATHRTGYSAVVPTYGVPAEGTSRPVRLQVTARTTQAAEFWRSGLATGASIDNLAPPAPLVPALAPEPAALRLDWLPVDVPDLAAYAVYRSPTPGFTPDATTFLALTDAPGYSDTGAAMGEPWFYRVSARDVNGNEGAPSPEVGTMAVATEGDGLPTAFALSGLWPNPVRGTAEVRYALPEAASVTLVVYDVQGRTVARLVDAWRPAGFHVATLRTMGLAGGAYVVRLTADAFVAARPLTVVR